MTIIPINVYKPRKIRGYEDIDWENVPTQYGRLGKVVKKHGNTPRFEDWKQFEYWVLGHRGATGTDDDGTTRPENTKAAIRAAYKLGLRLIEIDFSIDGKNVIFIFHDKRTDRWLRRDADFRGTAVSDWEKEDWRYYDVSVEGGQLDVDTRRPTEQYIIPLSELKELLDELPDLRLLIDCRDDEPPIVTARLSHMPELHDRIYIQVLNFGTRDARDFIDQVNARNPDKDWMINLRFVISPNPGAFYKLAQVGEHEITVENGFEAVWYWTKSFIEEKLRVCAFHIPRNGAGQFWKSDCYAKHERFGVVETRPDLTVFITDKIAMMIMERVKELYPHLPVLSPCAFPTWTSSEGVHFHSSFHFPLTMVCQKPETNPAHHFFLEASKAETHFEAGANIIVTDDIPGAFYYLAKHGKLGPVSFMSKLQYWSITLADMLGRAIRSISALH